LRGNGLFGCAAGGYFLLQSSPLLFRLPLGFSQRLEHGNGGKHDDSVKDQTDLMFGLVDGK